MEIEEIDAEKAVVKRGTDLSEFEIGFITACITCTPRKKAPEITKLLGIAGYQRGYETIKEAIRKIKAKVNFREERKKCGRKSKVGNDTKVKFLLEIEKDRSLSGNDLAKLEINHNNVTSRTVNNLLNNSGYLARIKGAKTILRNENKMQRLAFANEHLQWTEEH